ncbi:LysR family transcriptional regulator substrate-binding protein [Geminicoccus flavidas]|uniref:LysR family transcriptional regulator substrate-binding protein n=1 Tax=Geminicoccus flavidas TaxID=2506407 RepID=UPI00135AC3A8|nr:LysR family transcriptional regulator substrate-binding protein [Geminicoccus flavidas]
MLGLLRDLEHLLRQARDLEQGQLTLAADSPFAAMPLLRRLQDAHPGIAASLVTGNTATTLKALRDGTADAAVATLLEPAPDLARLCLGTDRVVLLLPRDHELAGSAQVDLRALDGVAMVAREEGSATFRLFAAACAATGIRPRLTLQLGSREALREAVAHGFGLGAVFEEEAGTDPRLVRRALAGQGLQADTCLLALAERAQLGVVKALFALAAGPAHAEAARNRPG